MFSIEKKAKDWFKNRKDLNNFVVFKDVRESSPITRKTYEEQVYGLEKYLEVVWSIVDFFHSASWRCLLSLEKHTEEKNKEKWLVHFSSDRYTNRT